MINLMYVVLMAMLALNVSSQVLDGFDMINNNIRRTTTILTQQNNNNYNLLAKKMQENPVKVEKWYSKADDIRQLSNDLFLFVDTLKKNIITAADGENNTDSLVNKEDLEAAAQVMLTPMTGKGNDLFNAISNYRDQITQAIEDPTIKNIIKQNLSTDVPKTAGNKQWTEYMFESTPAIAAVTMLTKLQSDIRYAEGEALHAILDNIDIKDVRVNKLKAFVITDTKTIIKGNRINASIVMAAVDTTQIPEVFINNKKVKLQNGILSLPCPNTGNFTLSGWINTKNGLGETVKENFSQSYTVVEPTATVSADLMNVLYAGYNNPISISVPGAPLSSVSATMEGGTLSQTAPGKYLARPSKIGQDAVITVFSNYSSSKQQMAQYAFKVRKLPEPTPFIDLRDDKGNPDRYRGGPIPKAKLLAATRIGAAVDDGLLNIPFKVLSFEMVFFDNMGDAVPIISDGANFSTQQKETIKRLNRNKRLYISRLTAVGPDGITRKLNTSMEVIIR